MRLAAYFSIQPKMANVLLASSLIAATLIPINATAGEPASQSFRDSFVNRLAQKAPPKSQEAFALQALDADEDNVGLINRNKATSVYSGDGSDSSSSTNDDGPPVLKGGITSLKVTRGRSQIIKFAQPIPRVSIADPTLADVIPLAPDQLMINGKERGVTSLVVWDENGQEGIFDLYIEKDTTELLKAIESIAPNEKIDVHITDDSFILSGQVSNSVILEEIRQLAAAYGYRDENFKDITETPVPQVILEVKIAEASRTVLDSLKTAFSETGTGVTLSRLSGGFDGNILSNGLARSGAGLIPGSGFNALRTPDQFLQGLNNNNNIGGILGTFRDQNFNVAFDLLSSDGKVTVLAEPKLVCTHGRTASFLAGGEFPFISGVDQNGSPIIQFREFGVRLAFTPWIAVRTNRIELKVEPEVSELDRSNCLQTAAGLVCGLRQRRTETTVELRNGESLMISGILEKSEENNFAKVPFIADVPILGALFKNADFTKRDRELMVVITPHIVNPGDYGTILGGS
ncbi:MAG: pilus assembly protein N-terminal domain-containing protein [Vampirovibrio sp.]|nr:pilus assembly protein N-terminal domain-containing protein [Vampirovibrio sp.]